MARRVDHPYAAILHSHADYVTNAIFSLHLADAANPHAVTKAQVGLGNADNTSDVNKPVSTAQQTALDLKANLASPTFTGTVGGITKSMVGLANVDNTSDANKPVSTAQQTALNLKANLASPTFTGTVVLPSGQTITLPTIASFANATHNHQAAAGGGTLDAAAITAGVLGTARLASTGTPSSSTFLRGDQSWSVPAGGGDVAGPAASVDSEIAIFSGTTGKILKRATTTGLLKASSGVLAAATAGTDYYNPGGTDVAVADGGTGASTAATARANLGAVNIAGDTMTGLLAMGHGADAIDATRYVASAAGPFILMKKSRSGVVGTNTIVQNGDSVGGFGFYGGDGTSYVPAALIGATIDGTPGTNDMPGMLVFYTTADGASSSTERMRISQSGSITMSSLAGTGNRSVIASSTGLLSAPAGQPAWTLLSESAFSAAASVSVNSVFSSTYDNYMLEVNIADTSAVANVYIKLRVGGVDSSAGYDFWGVSGSSSAVTVNGTNAANATTGHLFSAGGGSGAEAFSTIMVGRPGLVRKTSFNSQGGGYTTVATAFSTFIMSGGHRTAAAYDGFTIIPASGTITGTVRTYGIRNTP